MAEHVHGIDRPHPVVSYRIANQCIASKVVLTLADMRTDAIIHA